MSKYTVHWCNPYLTYEDVTADSEEDAVKKCPPPENYDYSDGPMIPVVLWEGDDEI